MRKLLKGCSPITGTLTFLRRILAGRHPRGRAVRVGLWTLGEAKRIQFMGRRGREDVAACQEGGASASEAAIQQPP